MVPLSVRRTSARRSGQVTDVHDGSATLAGLIHPSPLSSSKGGKDGPILKTLLNAQLFEFAPLSSPTLYDVSTKVKCSSSGHIVQQIKSSISRGYRQHMSRKLFHAFLFADFQSHQNPARPVYIFFYACKFCRNLLILLQ